MIYLTCLYTCIFLHLEDLFLTSEGEASLKALEEKQSGRGQARIKRRVSGESFLSSCFLFCTLELIACKFYKYVGNPKPSVIRCLFLYNIIDHQRYSIMSQGCEWKSYNKVHGNEFPFSHRNIVRLEEISLVSMIYLYLLTLEAF